MAAKKSGKKRPGKSQNRAREEAGTGKSPARKNKKGMIKKDVPKKKMGRPPVPYDEKRHPEWVRGLASRGSNVREICQAMGISSKILYAWRDNYPDFRAALQVGRNETIARIHNSLVKRATGFSVPTKRTESTPTYEKVIESEEYFPPDVGAAKLLLLNLDPTFKTERTETEISGKDGGPLESTIIIIPDNGRDKAITGKKGAKSH